jgi:diguanylate cyclase (GGDEF)-like protein
MIRFLARDRLSLLVLAVGLACLAASVLQLWPASPHDWVARNTSDAVMVVTLILVAFSGRWAIASSIERSFWLLWGGGFTLLVGAHATFAIAGGRADDGIPFVVWSLFVVGFYLLVALALALRPHMPGDKRGHTPWMQWLEISGVLILGLGMFVYFAVVPLVTAPGPSSVQTRTMLMLFGFDGYLCLRLVESFRTSADRRWRATYLLFFVSFCVWLTVDLSILLGRLNVVGHETLVSIVDKLWLPPYLAFAWAIRLRQWTEGDEAEDRTRLSTQELRTLAIQTARGTLWFHAAMLAVLHVIFETADLLDPRSQLAQQGSALAVLLANGLLAVAYQRRLESENVSLANEREQAVEAARQAYHDPLTGLPNRYLLLDHLRLGIAQAMRDEHLAGVFFIDIDRFKTINDSLGHSAGDELLVQVASRFTCCIRTTDTLARLGGDEFIVVAPGLRERDDVTRVGEKLLDSLRDPFTLGSTQLFVTASIGVAVFPDSGSEPDTLLRDADIAMYRAKAQGGGTIQVFDADSFGEAVDRLSLETMLRRAVFDEGFVLHFQPIVDVRLDRMVGCEALIRWVHPERGLLLPAEFLETAEICGVTSRLTPWLLEESCRWAARWTEQTGAPIRIAVNLSPRQFLDSRFSQYVESALEKSGLAGQALELEITESVAMQSVERIVQTLTGLKKLGVQIAIDDFGTGYSSLHALRTLPIDTLKIDRSFVKGIATNHSDAAITSTILAVANTLGLSVVAEGVETTDQLDMLSRLGCNLMQGYLFSPPIPPEGIPDLLGESLLPPDWKRKERLR